MSEYLLLFRRDYRTEEHKQATNIAFNCPVPQLGGNVEARQAF
jgi:hypothetical protein